MRFREALKKAFLNKKSSNEITDPFLLYSTLSDMCKSGYESKEKLSLFFQIDKRIHIFGTYFENKRNAKDVLMSKYSMVSDIISQSYYENLINVVMAIVTNQPITSSASQVKKPVTNNQSPTLQGAIMKKAKAPPQAPKPVNQKPVNQFAKSGFGDSLVAFLGIVGVFGGILFAVVLFVCACACPGWDINLRQWIIGIISSIMIVCVSTGIIYVLDDEIIIDAYISANIWLAICAVTNFILLVILRSSYKIVFGIYSAVEIVAGIVVAHICNDDFETGLAIFQIFVLIVEVVLMIIGYSAL